MWLFFLLQINLSEGKDYIFITLGYSILPNELGYTIIFFFNIELNEETCLWTQNNYDVRDSIGILMWIITKPSLFPLLYIPANYMLQRNKAKLYLILAS